VTFSLKDRAIRAILLDVEGTTTPVGFVYDVLFPFARTRLGGYLGNPNHAGTARDVVKLLRREWATDLPARRELSDWRDDAPETAATYLEWLMDRDVKSPALKLLQGLIWEGGYRSGELQGQVFGDVPPAFVRWRDASVAIAIYSSGSVLAQRLLFGATPHGDLTPFISGFFDTGVGAKRSPDSYRRIAAELDQAPRDVLFVSDTSAELDAARSAGCQVLIAERPGNRSAGPSTAEAIRSFDEIA
jgi:enolase-phosphatase E1